MEFPGLSAALRGSGGYACQYVARTQVSRQLSVRFWPAPSTNRRNRAACMQVVLEGLDVCSKKMRRGSESEASRAAPSNGPRDYSTVLDNVVRMTVFGIANTFDGAPAPHLRVSGRDPRYGRDPVVSLMGES